MSPLLSAAPPGPASSAFDAPAFDVREFDDLSEMIGEDGVMEMVMIFEAETRHRLDRLRSGPRDVGTLVRETHTLKGAAGTVAAPRLTQLGRTLELAARKGIAPSADDVERLRAALEAWLAAVHVWADSHLHPA